MGHKHVTTTKEYLHSNLEEAEAVLFPTSYLTSPADAAPTTAELIAQALLAHRAQAESRVSQY